MGGSTLSFLKLVVQNNHYFLHWRRNSITKFRTDVLAHFVKLIVTKSLLELLNGCAIYYSENDRHDVDLSLNPLPPRCFKWIFVNTNSAIK